MSVFQDIHLYLIISFLLMMYVVYKFGYKSFSSYISNGISEIKSELDALIKEKKRLECQVSKLSLELGDAKRDYDKVLNTTKLSAEEYVSKRNLQLKDLIGELELKNQQTMKTIEYEYTVKIRNKLTELVIKRLSEKIQEPNNVKQVSLASITNAVQLINQLTEK